MLKNALSNIIPAEAEGKDKFFHVLTFLIPVFMGLYIFCNPFPISVVNEATLYLSLAALILLLIFKKTSFSLRSPLTLPFALFFIWSVFGLFYTLDFQNTLHDLYSHLLKYLLVFYLLFNFFQSPKRFTILSWILIASATVFSAGGMIIFYLIEGHSISTRFGLNFKHMFTGFNCFITTFAAILSIFYFQKNKVTTYKVLFFSCFLINTLATLLTQTRSAVIGLFAAFVILCFDNKKNLIFIVLPLLIILLIPGTKDRLTQEGVKQDIRGKMYRLSLEVIKERPIAGVGFGMEIYGTKVDLEKFNSKLPPEYQQHTSDYELSLPLKQFLKDHPNYELIITSTHSTILDIAIRTGIVGLALFLYILLQATWVLWKTFRLTKDEYYKSWAIYLFASLVSFMLTALFIDAMFGPRAIIFYTILAMIAMLWNITQKELSLTAESH
jgi:O-antigen ligase